VNFVQQPGAGFAPGVDADDEMFDVVNLVSGDTGLVGIVFVSTAQGAHGPRVKWYPGRPGRDAPCLAVTLEAEPRVINLGLPRVQAAGAEAPIRAWVRLNREPLLEFWWNGLSWTRDEVNAFIDGLAKLP
jgi:hypothetical protein